MTAPAHGLPPAVSGGPRPHAISVVIPVYQGARTLPALLRELAPLADGFSTPHGTAGGRHRGAAGPRQRAGRLGRHDPRSGRRSTSSSARSGCPATSVSTRPPWPAWPPPAASGSSRWTRTASTTRPRSVRCSTWRSTIRPTWCTRSRRTTRPTERCATPRPGWPNASITASAGTATARDFHSYRLILGEVGRSVAAYAGAGAYLDVVMTWVATPDRRPARSGCGPRAAGRPATPTEP